MMMYHFYGNLHIYRHFIQLPAFISSERDKLGKDDEPCEDQRPKTKREVPCSSATKLPQNWPQRVSACITCQGPRHQHQHRHRCPGPSSKHVQCEISCLKPHPSV